MKLAQPENPDQLQTEQFLRLCLNARRHPADLESARKLSSQIDWNSASATIEKQFIRPLLYRNLKGSGILPEGLENVFRIAYLDTAQRNILQAEAVKRLLEVLSKKGIEAILMKGVALSILVYRDIASRPSRDIDLLLEPGDLHKALAEVEGLGYKLYDTPEHPETDFEFESETIAFRQEDGSILDLHWSLFDSPYYQNRLDLDWFWKNTVEFNLAGMNVRTFAPESNLIYLCGHTVLHHSGKELLWLSDIAELLDCYQTEIDWKLVLQKAQEFNLVLPLRKVFDELTAAWHAKIPAIALQELHEVNVSKEEKRIFEKLAGERMTSGKHFWSDFQDLVGWHNKIRYTLQMLFPTLEYMRHRYKITKPSTILFYYPYRWYIGIVSLFNARK